MSETLGSVVLPRDCDIVHLAEKQCDQIVMLVQFFVTWFGTVAPGYGESGLSHVLLCTRRAAGPAHPFKPMFAPSMIHQQSAVLIASRDGLCYGE